MASYIALRFNVFLLFISFLSLGLAVDPAQFCKFGYAAKEIDFCTGISVQHNQTTNSHNVYLSFSHSRPAKSAKGWTAIGFGEHMKGSLMIIVYGDPSSGNPPVVSIRESAGHVQPVSVTQKTLGRGDLQVLRSEWLADGAPNGAVTAMTVVVCYSCTLWQGSTISAETISQPFIWAWHENQEFKIFPQDAHLLMHEHHAGNGGWGQFYVDMSSAAINDTQLPYMPIIRPGIASHGASEFRTLSSGGLIGWVKRNPILHLHGFLMVTAFIILFPLGVIAMRSGSPKSFKYHWIIQVSASVGVAGGVITGLTLRKHINSFHQTLGLCIVGALVIQAILGYKHHIDFVRIHRRTWISYTHIWVGRIVMLGAFGNLIIGLNMRGYSPILVGVAGVFMILEAVGLIFWVWRRSKVDQRRGVSTDDAAQWSENQPLQYFAVESDAEDEEDSDEETAGNNGHKR